MATAVAGQVMQTAKVEAMKMKVNKKKCRYIFDLSSKSIGRGGAEEGVGGGQLHSFVGFPVAFRDRTA